MAGKIENVSAGLQPKMIVPAPAKSNAVHAAVKRESRFEDALWRVQPDAQEPAPDQQKVKPLPMEVADRQAVSAEQTASAKNTESTGLQTSAPAEEQNATEVEIAADGNLLMVVSASPVDTVGADSPEGPVDMGRSIAVSTDRVSMGVQANVAVPGQYGPDVETSEAPLKLSQGEPRALADVSASGAVVVLEVPACDSISGRMEEAGLMLPAADGLELPPADEVADASAPMVAMARADRDSVSGETEESAPVDRLGLADSEDATRAQCDLDAETGDQPADQDTFENRDATGMTAKSLRLDEETAPAKSEFRLETYQPDGHVVAPTAPTQAEQGSRPAPAAAPPIPIEAQFAEANHPRIVTALRSELLPNGGTMQIRLDPPDLGAMQVRVEMRDGVLTASFQTANEEATRLLSHSLHQLKTALESQGVSVERLHVEQVSREELGDGVPDEGSHQQQHQDRSSQQEQQRREMLQRMWRRLMGGRDPLDVRA